MSSSCRQCGGRLLFVVTMLGKRMPLDPAPNEDGNVAVYRDDRGELVGHVLAAGQEPRPHERRYMPHFATCPARRPTRKDGTVPLNDRRRRRAYAAGLAGRDGGSR